MPISLQIPVTELSRGALEVLTERLLAENAALAQALAELRAEVAKLKGVKGRPVIKPSGMERGTEPKPAEKGRQHGAKGGKTERLAIQAERIIKADVPPGSRFKGYEDFLIQDLVLRPHVTRIRRERWLTPDGRTVTAPMPAEVVGHFGPELRRFVLFQYHQGQVTVPRLVAQLRSLGLAISKRQVVRLLNAGQDAFLTEARDVLRAGLAMATWISVDDTGARHRHRNGTCTQLGNDHFTAFATTASKSRLNFLEVLRAGYGEYVINAEALAYMRQRGLAGPVIAKLAEHPEQRFADQAAWMRHLERLGLAAPGRHPRPGAHRHGRGGVGRRQGAWPPARHGDPLRRCRPVRARPARALLGARRATGAQAGHLHRPAARAAQQFVRALIWWFYADLKAYRGAPDRRRRRELRARFDRIFRRRTGFVSLDRLLARLHANKEELLRVLDRPEVPLHTNGSERDLRPQVVKRKISGGTRSEAGRACRDAFLGLLQTCAKLGVSFWAYLGHRLGVPGAHAPDLPDLVRLRSAPA